MEDALRALNRAGLASLTMEASADLDSLDPEVNVNTATALVVRGLARFVGHSDGLVLMPTTEGEAAG
jgi:hypothetical protein